MYNKKNLRKVWISLIIGSICGCVFFFLLIYSEDISNYFYIISVFFVLFIYHFFRSLFYSWDYNLNLINVRIMWVKQWSSDKTEFVIRYYDEWECEKKIWFMGKLIKQKKYWTTSEYNLTTGFDTLEKCKEKIMNDLKNLKSCDKPKEIKVIEVLVVADEMKKLNIE